MSDNNGGQQTIEEITANGTVLDTTIAGSAEQLSFKMGSQFALSDSTLVIAKIPPLTVTGQFQEGDRVKVLVDVEVAHVSFPPIKERGFRVGTERRHHAEPLSASQHA